MNKREFYHHIKLHHSQTFYGVFDEDTEFYHHIKLHHSQTPFQGYVI